MLLEHCSKLRYPQNGDDAPDNREIQAHKKRRTDTNITSYAEKANAPTPATNAWNKTAATAPTHPSLEDFQTMLSTQLAAQMKVTESLLTAQSDKNLERMNLLADEQQRKLQMQENNITRFVQETIQSNNKALSDGLNEHMKNALEIHSQNLSAILANRSDTLLQQLEQRLVADMEQLKEKLYPPAKNRMDLEDEFNHQLTPAVNPGSAANDTGMSLRGLLP